MLLLMCGFPQNSSVRGEIKEKKKDSKGKGEQPHWVQFLSYFFSTDEVLFLEERMSIRSYNIASSS